MRIKDLNASASESESESESQGDSLKSNKNLSSKRFERVHNYKLLSRKDFNIILSNPKSFLKI